MRYLPAILACVACSGATAATPAPLTPRDGAWLQKGVKQYQRWAIAHETLSDADMSDAMTAKSYVCAVTDLEKNLVERATTLSQALRAGKSRKQHLDAGLLDGMMRALPIVLPLTKTDFLQDSPSCDRALALVHDYLETYPEMLSKDADDIVERALLDAYTKSAAP
jgi:hypothetical protein